MTINLIKTRTESQQLFQKFLDGESLPMASSDKTMQDLLNCRPDYYQVVLERVQRRLNSSLIETRQDVAFVEFLFIDKQAELPVLIRFLNLVKFRASMFIVVNDMDLAYIPPGAKKTYSINELVEAVKLTRDEHKRINKRKQALEKLRNFFTFGHAIA